MTPFAETGSSIVVPALPLPRRRAAYDLSGAAGLAAAVGVSVVLWAMPVAAWVALR